MDNFRLSSRQGWTVRSKTSSLGGLRPTRPSCNFNSLTVHPLRKWNGFLQKYPKNTSTFTFGLGLFFNPFPPCLGLFFRNVCNVFRPGLPAQPKPTPRRARPGQARPCIVTKILQIHLHGGISNEKMQKSPSQTRSLSQEVCFKIWLLIFKFQ